MTNTARVMEIIPGGIARVVVTRVSACSHDCKSCGGGCGGGERKMIIEVQNEIGAAVGDFVYIKSPTPEFFKKSFLVYIFPMLVLVATYILLSLNLKLSEGVNAVLSLAACAICYWGISIYDKRLKKRGGNLPVIIAKIKN